MRDHKINWVAPAPLWSLHHEIHQPLLLEIEGDDFMDRLGVALEKGPDALVKLKPGLGASGEARLHQPIHGRYGLVLASLCCVLPGLPEHAVDSRCEELCFVLRRLVPGGEEAWIPAKAGRGVWSFVEPDEKRGNEVYVDGEERVALFPLAWQDGERRRRLWGGVLPLSGRELWDDVSAADASERPPPSAWEHGLEVRVIQVVHRLVEARDALETSDPEDPPTDEEREARRQERLLVSAWCLTDLLELIRVSFPSQYARIVAGAAADPSSPLGAALADRVVPTVDGPRASCWDALRVVYRERASLQGPSPTGAVLRFDLGKVDEAGQRWLSTLLDLQPEVGEAGFPTTTERPRINPGTRYVVRCVYRKPDCCVEPTRAVSRPSAPFEVAGLFDPDAPARPIRIPLPTDISIAALRRFKPNVSFPFSAALNDKVSRLSSPDTFKGELGGGGGIGFGMICSLSIPVITLCASISLMIFISLFDIAFSWLAFIRICLPYPKPKEG